MLEIRRARVLIDVFRGVDPGLTLTAATIVLRVASLSVDESDVAEGGEAPWVPQAAVMVNAGIGRNIASRTVGILARPTLKRDHAPQRGPLIEQMLDPRDRRGRLLRLTDEGLSLVTLISTAMGGRPL